MLPPSCLPPSCLPFSSSSLSPPPFSVLSNYKSFRLFQNWPWIETSAGLRVLRTGERRHPIRHPLLTSPSPLQNSTLSPSASPPPTPPPLAQPSAGTAASFAISKLCIRRPWPSSLQLSLLVMASKLSPNVLYVAEHGDSLGSPQADSERTHIVSTAQSTTSTFPCDCCNCVSEC